MLAPGKWRELRPGEIGMLRNAVKTSTGAPETLGDLDEGILESASRKGRPAGRVQYQSQQRQRGFEERESSQRRGRERAGAPRREYGKSYTKGSATSRISRSPNGGLVCRRRVSACTETELDFRRTNRGL